MANWLIGIHAFLGEFAVLAFLWVFIELFNPGKDTPSRLRIISGLGLLFLLLAWVVGGYYYVSTYGSEVKPIILNGPDAWAHRLITEAKEHIFLLLPFLGMLIFSMIRFEGESLRTDLKMRKAIQWLSLLVVLIGLSMAGMGYLISTGVRTALEAGA
ncbi:MAG: hypothetical protein AABW68_02015 [archaeon]